MKEVALADIRFALLTVSDTRTLENDETGSLAERLLQPARVIRRIVKDERALISCELLDLSETCDVILTLGGTGFAPRDVTPEATRQVMEKEAQGIAERLRSLHPLGLLSRGVAGIRGRALIINLPGSPKAVEPALNVLVPVLPHAVALLQGDTEHE